MDKDDERILRKEKEVSTEQTNYGTAILAFILVIGLITIFAKGTTYNWSMKEFLSGMAIKTKELVPMNEILNFDRSISAIQQGQESFAKMTEIYNGTFNGFINSIGQFFKGLYEFMFLFGFNLSIDLISAIVKICQDIVILFQIITITY